MGSVEIVSVETGEKISGRVRQVSLTGDEVRMKNVGLFRELEEFVDEFVEDRAGCRIDERRSLIHDRR